MHTSSAGLLLANNGADILDIMTNILEDFDDYEMIGKSRERLSSNGSSETSGPVVRNDRGEYLSQKKTLSLQVNNSPQNLLTLVIFQNYFSSVNLPFNNFFSTNRIV